MKEILGDGLAVYGVEDVLKKSMEGAIELVQIDKNLRIADGYARNAKSLILEEKRDALVGGTSIGG